MSVFHPFVYPSYRSPFALEEDPNLIPVPVPVVEPAYENVNETVQDEKPSK